MFHDSLTVTCTTVPPIWLTCARTKSILLTANVVLPFPAQRKQSTGAVCAAIASMTSAHAAGALRSVGQCARPALK